MATLTHKNVPDDLYKWLKEQAAAHRRSLNQEAIAQLLAGTAGGDAAESALMRDVARFRGELQARGSWLEPDDVDAWIEEGRK